MDAVALPLAFPAILTGIRNFVVHFNSTDTRIENLLRKCRILERAISQLAEISSESHPDPLMDEITAECSQVIKSMGIFMAECVLTDSSTSPNPLSKIARLKFIWRDEDLNTLLTRLDDCRANVQLFLIMSIPRSQAQPVQSSLIPSTKASRRHSSIMQSDDDTLRFSFLSDNSRFSTTTLNINPDRDSAATIEFAFDQDIQSSKAYRRNLPGQVGNSVTGTHDTQNTFTKIVDKQPGLGLLKEAANIVQNLPVLKIGSHEDDDSRMPESLRPSNSQAEEDLTESPFDGTKTRWRDSTSLSHSMSSPASPWQHDMPMLTEALEIQSDQFMVHATRGPSANGPESLSLLANISANLPHTKSATMQLLPNPGFYNIVILGSSSSGKSELTAKFLGVPDTGSPITSSYKRFEFDRSDNYLSISVPAERGEFYFSMESERNELLRLADGFMLVFSLASRLSFENIVNEYVDCIRYKDRDTFPFILVAIDHDIDSEREVSFGEGRLLAQQNDWQFVQVPCIDSLVDAERCFASMLHQIAKWTSDEEERRGKKDLLDIEDKKKRFWSRK